MNMRATIIAGAVTVVLALGGGAAWWSATSEPIETAAPPAEAATVEPADGADSEPLPVPPVPPRIADGADYENCMAMLGPDPTGALAFAESWLRRGGGGGAMHCLAMAKIGLGNTEDGADMLRQLADAVTGSPAARASVYDQAEQAYLMSGAIDKAYAVALLALSLSPDDPDLLTDGAIAAGNLGRYQDALDDLTHALEIDPRRADALVLRGSAWRHLGRLELAMDDIDRALHIDPENAEALLERGIIKQRHDDRAGARRDWEQAASLAPDSSTADLAQQNLALLDAGPERK